jgi:hypothetical protein
MRHGLIIGSSTVPEPNKWSLIVKMFLLLSFRIARAFRGFGNLCRVESVHVVSRNAIGAVGVLMLVGVSPSVAYVDPNTVIDLRMDGVTIEGAKSELVLDGAKWVKKFLVTSGQTISISCKWSANLVGGGYWKTNIEQSLQYVIKIDQETKGLGPTSIPAHTTLGSQTKKGTGSSTTTHYGYEFSNKTPSIQWTAGAIGAHSINCILPETGFQEPDLNNNIAVALLEVVVSPTQQGKMLKKPGPTQTPGPVRSNEVVAGMPSAPQSAEGRASQRASVPPAEPIKAPGSDQSRRPSRSPDAGRVPSMSSDQPAGRTQPGQQMVARVPASMFTVEGEQLVHTGKASVNGGKIDVQPMAGFGQGWSQNAQLFWSGGSVGAVLDLTVDVPAASAYAVEVYLTRAPDYADLRLEIDGLPSPVTFSGFAPTVMAPNPMQAGKFSLQPGARKVSFMITGKYQQATNYFVGIDRIVFYPAGDP